MMGIGPAVRPRNKTQKLKKNPESLRPRNFER